MAQRTLPNCTWAQLFHPTGLQPPEQSLRQQNFPQHSQCHLGSLQRRSLCFRRPKHQSGENFVWPTIMKLRVMLSKRPIRTFHAQYYKRYSSIVLKINGLHESCSYSYSVQCNCQHESECSLPLSYCWTSSGGLS